MPALGCILPGGARAVECVNLTSPPRVAAVPWPLPLWEHGTGSSGCAIPWEAGPAPPLRGRVARCSLLPWNPEQVTSPSSPASDGWLHPLMIDSTSQGCVRVEKMMSVMCASAISEGLSKQ